MNATNRHGSATVTLQGDREVVITRQFDAPARLAFQAYTTLEMVRKWWGYKRSEWLECSIDLRVGGKWRYVIREKGHEVGFPGVYRDIDAPGRLVHTEGYEGFPGGDANGAIDTIRFEEKDGVTTMTTHVLHVLPEHRDAHIQSGMEKGMQISFNQLEDIVVELAGGI